MYIYERMGDIMVDLLELFKEIDVNNIFFMVAASIGVIVIFASCMRPFFASTMESLLMNKEDELKRLSLIYVIMFFLFGIMNYVFISDASFIVVCIAAMVLMLIVYFVLWGFNKFRVFQQRFLWYKDRFGITFILITFPIIAYVCSFTTGIKMAGCAILCALAEIIIIAMLYLNPGPRDSSIFIKINDEKWYVFRRIDNDYLLCGDGKNIKISTRIKLLELSIIVQNDNCFEKENSESE